MSYFTSFDPDLLNTGKLHKVLLSSIAPRPIAFASTIDAAGNVNLAPFSFFNVFSANPPILIFSPARKGRDNTAKHSYLNVREVPEVVINTVSYSMVQQMSLASSEFEKGVNEFTKSGLTEVPSIRVAPPRVKESPVSLECKVLEVKELGQSGGAGNLVICQVELIHVLNEFVREDKTIKSNEMDLVGRMGENYYNRLTAESIFEVIKPSGRPAIGVDALPQAIRNSAILSGNDLGKLGSCLEMPDTDSLARAKSAISGLSQEEVHRKIKQHLSKDQVEEALCLAML